MGSKLDRVGDWDRLAEEAHFEVRKLATLSKVTVRQLDRFFRRSFGESPELWMKHRRLKEAQALLIEGKKSIKEIASALGFKQVAPRRGALWSAGLQPIVFGK